MFEKTILHSYSTILNANFLDWLKVRLSYDCDILKPAIVKFSYQVTVLFKWYSEMTQELKDYVLFSTSYLVLHIFFTGSEQTPLNRAYYFLYLSRIMRKTDFCLCKNKDADQLRGDREADQRLCFRYTDSTIPLLSESEISSL